MKLTSQNSSHGLITLSEGDGALIKKAILCITGTWMGMYGEVDVTKDMLEGVASRYNLEKGDALNPNDYAPILIDHERKADNVMGRIDISHGLLEVGPHPKRKGVFCLYGPMRIDDEVAQEKVKKGKYAQVSMSFDDETYELYEESFVAVEAARGSQVLSKGDKHMKKKKVVALSMVNGMVKKNREVSLAVANGVKAQVTSVTNLKTSLAAIELKMKSASIKSLCHGLVREGKMTPAEYKALDIVSLAGLDPKALEAVTKAYTSRKPSSDLQQYGVEGAAATHKQLTPKEFRALAALQKAGKGAKNLSADETVDDSKDPAKANLSGDQGDDPAALESSDVNDIKAEIEKCMTEIKAITETVEALKSSVLGMDIEDKKEEELSSGDDDSEDGE